MTHGRENFCRLLDEIVAQNLLEELPRVVIPQYDEHRGITVAFH